MTHIWIEKAKVEQALEALELMVAVEWLPAFTRKEYDSDEPEENEMRERVLTVITSLRQAIATEESSATQERMVCIGYWNQKTGAYYRPDQIAESHKKLLEEGILRRCYTYTQPKDKT